MHIFRNYNAWKNHSLSLIRHLYFESQAPSAVAPLLHLPSYDANILIGRHDLMLWRWDGFAASDLFLEL